MILGVGIDLLHFPRLVGLVRRQGGPSRLARRILSTHELAEFEALTGVSTAAQDQDNASESSLKYLAVR
jgi:phosphopantetheinyl transferase (holo-ACP synthase)